MLTSSMSPFDLLSIALRLGEHSVATGGGVIPPVPSRCRIRNRTPGAARPAGSKLARKAARGQLTKCHPGLSPKIAGRFPFSAKRRDA